MDLNFTLSDIKQTAEKFLALTAAHKVFALHGEMGAGKTTFVHAVCDVLRVKDAVSSPTFSIINQYKTGAGEMLYHIDLYRVKDTEEAVQSGIEDALFSGNYCFVEWPERAPSIFPDDSLRVSISLIDNNTRKLTFNL